MFGQRKCILILLFTGCFIAGLCDVLREDFDNGKTSLFISEDDCKIDAFSIEQYKDYPNITKPYGSKGYFLKIDNSGCMVTGPLPLEPGSQLIIIYKLVVPGIDFTILVGDNSYKPDLNFTNWESFIQIIDDVPQNTQLKIKSELVDGNPLLIIDSLQITPPLRKRSKHLSATSLSDDISSFTHQTMTEEEFKAYATPEPSTAVIPEMETTVTKSPKLKSVLGKSTSKLYLVDISETPSITMQTKLSEKDLSTSTPKTERIDLMKASIVTEQTQKPNPNITFKERQLRRKIPSKNEQTRLKEETHNNLGIGGESDPSEGSNGVEKAKESKAGGSVETVKEFKADDAGKDPEKVEPIQHPDQSIIDPSSGTTVVFWTYLAIVSLLLVILIVILVMLINCCLVRRNCI